MLSYTKYYARFNRGKLKSMKSIPFSSIRESLTTVANEVQFYKESYFLTKNNKPVLGIVPAETLLLLEEVLELARTSKEVAKVIEKYTLAISKEEYDNILTRLEELPSPNKRMLASMRAAERDFDN